jgi:DNA-binding GntR family transcriptional regulator
LSDQLEHDIVAGAPRPGKRLDGQSLAARFGGPRAPNREALMQLAAAGLVELQALRLGRAAPQTVDQRPPALGDRAHQLLQEARVHNAGPIR